MQNIPIYISVSFILTTCLTIFIFYKAANNSKTVLFILLAWLLLQTIIALNGFYTITKKIPPPFILTILPPFLLIIILFISVKGRQFINSLNIRTLTSLHIIRIPVELILFSLFIYKAVPKLITFEGKNFDILAGITAPFIYYLGFIKEKISTTFIIAWNFICLLLLVNIVMLAVLSAPFKFQQFAFDQPNIAILYFPYVWLPCCVVPLVLFSHLVVIKKLLRQKGEASELIKTKM